MRCVSLTGRDSVQLDGYPPALSAQQIAEILGISRVHAWRLISSGEIPSFRLGRLNRVPRAAIEHLLTYGSMDGYQRSMTGEVAPEGDTPGTEDQS